MNMIDRLTKFCTRRHECEWHDRCKIAKERNGLLPITPQHTGERCDFIEPIGAHDEGND